MVNLICFPHYTCGGLLCDIMTKIMSPIGENGGIVSLAHRLGKIGDNATVFVDYNSVELIDKIKQHKKIADPTDQLQWVGTHCWPGNLPLAEFNQVINITTTTYQSKLYRWYRAYMLYFKPLWGELTGMDLIDKMRETAKNYIIPAEPVFSPSVINLEFADVVHQTEEFKKVVECRSYKHHMERWLNYNNFLLKSPDLWNHSVSKSFYEAEFEINLKRYYQYDPDSDHATELVNHDK